MEESRPKTQRWNSGRDCEGRNLTYHRHVFPLRQPSEAKDTHHCWRRLRRACRPCLALRHGHLPLSQKAATHRVCKHAGFHGPQSSRALCGAPRSSSHGRLPSARTLPRLIAQGLRGTVTKSRGIIYNMHPNAIIMTTCTTA
jgi:hypothetical protein